MTERRLPIVQPAARSGSPTTWPDVVARLRDYAGRRPAAADERCEFCSADLETVHGHVVDVPGRALICVCRPCYLLFTHDGAGGSRFRAVPDRYVSVGEVARADDAWEALQIPIGLAFVFVNSATGRPAAFYPSPAGATESELPLDAWQALVSTAPILGSLAPDVEALLVRRTESSVDAVLVPIDICYELVGRIRRAWRGFQGGDAVWQEIDAFFVRVLARAGGEPACP